MRHSFFVLALTLVVALLPAGARAQVALQWRRQPGAEACPDADGLRELVRTRVGSDSLRERGGAQRTLEGEVVPLSPGHRVQLWLREQGGELLGERTLVDASADCTALTEATALAVALLFELAPPTKSAPPAAAAPDRQVVERPLPATPARWRYAVAAGAVGTLALLPAPRAHAFVSLRVAPRQTYAIALSLVALGGARVQLGGDSLGSARFRTSYALLAACRTIAPTRWLGLAACAGLVAGVLRADGSGFSERDYRRRAPLLAGSAQVVTEVALFGPLAASLALSLGVPLVHTRFVALDTNALPRELTSTRPVFGTVALGLSVRF